MNIGGNFNIGFTADPYTVKVDVWRADRFVEVPRKSVGEIEAMCIAERKAWLTPYVARLSASH
jgi:hypothetical protein